MIQKIFILWASWNVWRELVRQIYKNDSIKNHANPSQIVWIANSKKYIFDSRWISIELLEKVSKSKDEANKVFDTFWTKINKLTDLLEVVNKQWLNWEVVFADVTAGKDELLKFHKKLISDTQNFLVTANKNPISLYSMSDFKYLTAYNGRYDTNTTVMWWAWVLNFVDERVDRIVDKIEKIEWMFSWTLGYIMSELEKLEKPFSVIVREAKEKWYTEPNPWDDLNWVDVARKLIILARYAWYNVEMKDVEIKPLISEKYSKFEWEEFLKSIKKEDELFNQKVLSSNEQGEVLRYVWEMNCTWKKVTLKVWIKSIPKNSDLWTLEWTSNLALVETGILKSPLPHVIKSRWAWLEVTAWAVRVGIAKMLPNNIKTR